MYVNCVVLKRCGLAGVGEIVRLKIGYALYLCRNKYVLIASKGVDLTKLSYNKVTKELDDNIASLESIAAIHIAKNVKPNGALYERITVHKIESELKKNYNINVKFFSLQFGDDYKDIRNIGKYTLQIFLKDKQIKSIEVLVVASNK